MKQKQKQGEPNVLSLIAWGCVGGSWSEGSGQLVLPLQLFSVVLTLTRVWSSHLDNSGDGVG